MPDRALDGLRVVEFTDEIGSYCGRLLADHGAEVIKVEPPGGGRERHNPPFYKSAPEGPNTSLAFWIHNTSKKSVVLDLETEEGRAQARALALTADVVLEDHPVGYMAAHGLGYETLKQAKPKLVYTSVTGFGQTGPHAKWSYSDLVGQAVGGIMTLAGFPDDPPFAIYGEQGNVSASLEAAQGTLLAVLAADATGIGQSVDVSAQEALLMSQETAMMQWDFQKMNRARAGGRGLMPIDIPGTGVYECKDGHVVCMALAPGGADFPVLVEWMKELGMAEDLDQEPYASVVAGLNMAFVTALTREPDEAAKNIPYLSHIQDVLIRFFKSLSAKEAYEGGQTRKLLNGIVSTPKDLAENTQLRARGWYKPVKFDDLNVTIEFPGGPYLLSSTPVALGRPPRLGEHTNEVLASLANRSAS